MRHFYNPQDQFRKTFHCYLLLLLILPLPLGSNRVWAWSFMAMVTFLVFALRMIGGFRHKISPPKAFVRLRIPVVMLGLWLAYTLLTTLPIPSATVQILSPSVYEIYALSGGGIAPDYIPLSIDAETTMHMFLKSSMYVSIFVLTLLLVTSKERLKLVAMVVVFVGLMESLYGLFNTLSGAEYIFMMKKEAFVGFVTGTFINRNHFAGFLEMVIPVALGLVISGSAAINGGNNWRGKARFIITFIMGQQGRITVYMLVMIAAFLLSASRAGLISFGIAIGIVLLITARFKGKDSREMKITGLIVALALIAGMWLGMGTLPDRLYNSYHHIGPRLIAWENSLAIIKDFPFFGTGAGTYQYIFARYEDGRLLQYYDHAHNDYIELLADQGIVGFCLLAFPILMIITKNIKAFIHRKTAIKRAILFASLVGTFSLLIHSLIDFNFHIPANAAYFYLMLGLGAVAGNMSYRQSATKKPGPITKNRKPYRPGR